MSDKCLIDAHDSGDKSPAAALASYMSELSEECWCAGWLSGCEFALWMLANDGGGHWGQDIVTPEAAAQLLALSEEAGGWVRWADGVGAVFVPMDEWKEMRP